MRVFGMWRENTSVLSFYLTLPPRSGYHFSCLCLSGSGFNHLCKYEKPCDDVGESEAVCKESNPFQAKLNITSVYCLNSKVHPGIMAVKGEKELCKQG
jgi:hypothetical protein